MIPIHTNWLLQENQKLALIKFIYWIKQNVKDAYFTTITEMLLWLTDIKEGEEASPPEPLIPTSSNSCTFTQSCPTDHQTDEGINEVRYLATCNENCPDVYPWLN